MVSPDDLCKMVEAIFRSLARLMLVIKTDVLHFVVSLFPRTDRVTFEDFQVCINLYLSIIDDMIIDHIRYRQLTPTISCSSSSS